MERESFIVDSMNPIRNASPMPEAAHSLYEQGDPYYVMDVMAEENLLALFPLSVEQL